MNRQVIYSQEYLAFEQGQNIRAQEKLRYATHILQTMIPVPTNFVKKIVNSDFYELRVKVDNEIRVIIFALDNDNINLASQIVFLNGFIKKGTNDYSKEIYKAINILKKLLCAYQD